MLNFQKRRCERYKNVQEIKIVAIVGAYLNENSHSLLPAFGGNIVV